MSKYLLVFFLLAGASFAWLSGWSYMAPVNITSASALTDYQVQVNPNIYNNTGLVGSWHFSESAGMKAADLSGNGFDGTLTSGPAWASGKFGNGIQFDGVDDYVDAGNKAALNPRTGNFTIEAWVKGTGIERMIVRKGFSGGDYMFMFMTSGVLRFNMYDGTNDRNTYSTTAINDNAWHHLVGTRTGNTLQVYVDGNAEGTPSTAVLNDVNPNAAFIIGKAGTQNQWYFNGIIDEVRIYNRSLSPAEIQEHYNATKARLDYADLRFTQLYSVYEVPISVSGTGSELTDYQVLLNITNQTLLSHMRADGADIRLFSSATSTPYSSTGLAYWIESINSTQAKVWVKANVSSTGSTLYLYYGNSSAQAQSNGSATFVFFDDFSGDLSKWTEDTAAASLSGGIMTATGNGADRHITSKQAFSPSVEAVFYANASFDQFDHYLGLTNSTQQQQNEIRWYAGGMNGAGSTVRMYLSNGGTPTIILTTDSLPGFARYRIRWETGKVSWFRDNTEQAGSPSTIADVPSVALPLVIRPYDNGKKWYFDYVLVRKISATEPAASIGSETEISTGNEALLNHWLESDKSAWVKVPSIPAGASSINMHYGNPPATYNSSQGGSNAFIIYNDGSSLAGTTQVAMTGYSAPTWSTEAGKIKATGGATNKGGFLYFNQPTGISNYALEMSVRSSVTGNYEPQYGFRFDTSQSNANRGQAMYLETDSYNKFDIVSSAGVATFSAAQARDSTIRANWKLIKNGNSRELFENGISKASDSESWDAQNVGIYFYDGSQSTSAWFGDFRARKYSSPEPTSSLGAEQQADTISPSVQIQSPTGTTYNTSNVSVNFTATDAAGVSCTVRLNGTINSSTCGNYTLTLSNGAYTLNVTANDPSGNTNSSQAQFTVFVVTDAAPPAVSIQSPANATYATGAIPVNFMASDDTAVSACTVRLNGTVNSTTCSNYTLTLGNGAYTLNVSANDSFGKLNSSSVSFTVSILPSVSNSTLTNPDGIGNVSLNGIPPGASRIVYSVGSNAYPRSFSVSAGVLSVRISAKVTLKGTPASGKTLTFQAS